MSEVTFSETQQYLKGVEENRQSVRFDPTEFDRAISILDGYFSERLERGNKLEKEKFLELQHKATTGHVREIQAMKATIQDLVEEYNLQNTSFPPMYENLIDALYHETWGLGAVSVWYERHSKVGKCRVNGTDVWYRLPGERHRMHEQFRTAASVNRVIQNLMRNDEQKIMSRGKEHAQLQMADGTRVTISMPPLALHPTIVFRRAVVQNYTLQQQTELLTISKEAIPIYRMLVRCGMKMVITGEPGTGKTTFLVSLFGETKPDKVTISCESEFEAQLKKKFPDRDITEYQASQASMESDIIPLTLRQDTQQYIMAETREKEAPAFKEACANTTGVVMTTMHETDSTNVPGTLARKELRQSQGLNYHMCLVEYAAKIDFVLVMSYGEDESVIRNVEVSALELDPFTLIVKSRRIIWFDGQQWCYQAELDPRLSNRMLRYDEQAFHEGMQRLTELAAKYPIPENERMVVLANVLAAEG
ncbi:ATPase, T2SS/T4P/T4SS family [Paenibacillus elgii]|uniref:ATPase, T2SS/T4P/T4SS family n=1 Tax=Paenibacillus elgii TaxID=189691 RepID=UPI0013D318B1|nr:ATPase, T2SS/T4P/T4SS family [Paenibacillus elgii]